MGGEEEQNEMSKDVKDSATGVGEQLVTSAESSTVSTKKHKVLIAVGLVIVAVILTYLAGALYFNSRFNPNTIIYGLNVSAQNAESVKAEINGKVDNYAIKIIGKDGQEGTVGAKDIDLKLQLGDSVENEIANENSFLWVRGIFIKNTLDIVDSSKYDYDEDKLLGCIDDMTFFNSDYLDQSLDARLEYSTGEVEVINEYYGNCVDKEKLLNVVKKAILEGTESIEIENEDCYIKPVYTVKSEKFVEAEGLLEKYLSAVINYDFGENSEVVDQEKIKDWVVVSPDFDVYFDRDKVAEFVKYIGKTYNTFGQTREFKTAYGDTVSVAGGDYGWRLNREAEIDGLVADIKEGRTILREPVYYQEAVNYGKNDIGNTYAEVDLTGQKMFMIVDGVKVLESDVVTGKPSAGHNTPAGTYGITYKQKKATLVGETYETEVAYWMPFNQDIGFHDATWQSSFGGKRYLTHGSHGCVNLPLGVAEKLYGYVYKNMPVVCYYRALSETATETTTLATETTTQATTEATTVAATVQQ